MATIANVMHETTRVVETQQDTNLSEFSDSFLRDSRCTGRQGIFQKKIATKFEIFKPSFRINLRVNPNEFSVKVHAVEYFLYEFLSSLGFKSSVVKKGEQPRNQEPHNRSIGQVISSLLRNRRLITVFTRTHHWTRLIVVLFNLF